MSRELAEVGADGSREGDIGIGRDGPRTPTQASLAAIWCNVLQVDHVTAADDFFRLGGNSVLALQVAARVEESLGPRLTLLDLFEHRTLGELAAAVEAGAGARRARDAVVRRHRRRGPVSLSQAAMLATRKSNGVPTVARLFRIVGPLDVAALERALNELVRRHEILRTVYRSTLRRHRQVVLPWSPVPLPVVDAREKRRDVVDHRQVVIDNITTPFDLGSGPVIRWTLVRLGKHEHLLSVSLHEIAGDGWSVPILLGELGVLYDDFAAGWEPSLSPPPLQYLDVALWQRKHLTRAARRGQLRYWKARLREAPLALDLVPDQWPTAFDEPSPRVAELRIPAGLVARADGLARTEGASLFLVLATVLQALLCRLTGSPRVVVRPTFANRTTAEIERMVGFFVNYLVVDTDAAGDPTVRELLARVRRDFLDATARADVPFHRILAHVARMKTVTAQWPAGRVRFQLFNFPDGGTLAMSGLRVEPQDHGAVASDHLAIAGSPLADGSLHLRLDYDGSLYGRATAERLLTRYRELLDQATTAPDTRLSALSLLDHGEPDRLRRASGVAISAAVAPIALLHESVAEHAAHNPDAVAMVTTAEAVTYRELDAWARAVAARLGSLGLGPGSVVVLCARPGPAFAAGLLGVLRAGAACLPVDDRLPKDLFDGLVGLGDPRASVIDASVAQRPRVDGEVVVLHDVGRLAAGGIAHGTAGPDASRPALAVPVSRQGEAPRAAVLSHEALARVALAQRSTLKLRRTDRVAELPAARVAAVPHALCAALTAGAAYVVADEGEPTAGWIADQRVTVCFADGPAARTCLSTGSPPSSLRLVVSDEAVVVTGGRSRVAVVEQMTMSEAGGPWAIAERPRTAEAPAFCGVPLPGARVYVVDASMNLAPPMVPGEVLVGGPGIADGYLGDPAADDVAFVPDRFSERPGGRLLRTGLTARVDAKGRIEVLGAGEGEWSARGMPMGVHLRSIEGTFREHPAVESVVARVEDALCEPRVVVYVVPVAGARVRGRDLRPLMPKGLPAPARPLAIRVLDRFPRRPDGRIDYAALGK